MELCYIYACQGGCVSLVQILIQEHKADSNARDNNTLLNFAAFNEKADVALSLICEFCCNVLYNRKVSVLSRREQSA